jgi:hypothetical protein
MAVIIFSIAGIVWRTLGESMASKPAIEEIDVLLTTPLIDIT